MSFTCDVVIKALYLQCLQCILYSDSLLQRNKREQGVSKPGLVRILDIQKLEVPHVRNPDASLAEIVLKMQKDALRQRSVISSHERGSKKVDFGCGLL